MERRLTKHPDGTVTGHFKTPEMIGNTNTNISHTIVGKFPEPVCGSPTFPTAEDIKVATTIFPQTVGQLSVVPGVASLTVDQRLIELKKKIAEYRTMLNVATDAATKRLIDLFLVNISKELDEIQTEFNKIPKQQQPLLQPSPSFPYQPSYPYPYPSIGDNITFESTKTGISHDASSVTDWFKRSDEMTAALRKGVEIAPGYVVAINNENKPLVPGTDYVTTEAGHILRNDNEENQ